MALTRKFLSAMGIDADKVDEIISAHIESIDGIKAERDSLKEKAVAYDELQDKLETAEKSIAEMTKEDYKSKYETVKNDFENYKKDIASKTLKANKQSAYKDLLKEVGISEKRFETILKVSNLDEYDFAEGNFTNHDKMIEAIKSEWSDFIPTISETGANISNPPANTGGSTFDAMPLADKMAFANANPNNADVVAWLSK